jgi:N,N-dimethylformamidase
LLSGLYFIKIIFNNNQEYYSVIIILPSINIKENLILLNTNTWQCYNYFGGASCYDFYLNDKIQYEKWKNKRIVSFNRPDDVIYNDIKYYINNNGIIKELCQHLLYGELRLIKFMYDNNIEFDICCDLDLANNNINLKLYNNLILNYHPEYWTDEQYNNIKNNSNNIISLAGNVATYSVYYNNNNRLLERTENYRCINDYPRITGSLWDPRGYLCFSPYKIVKNSIFFVHIKTDTFGHKCLGRWACCKGKCEGHEGGHGNTLIDCNKDGINGHESDKAIDVKDIIATDLYTYEDNFLKKDYKGADIIYINQKNGRKIFSTGSIVFCGGLFIDKEIDNLILNIFTRFKFNKIVIFCNEENYTKVNEIINKLGFSVHYLNTDDLIENNIDNVDVVIVNNNFKSLHLINEKYPKSKYIFITENLLMENTNKKILDKNNIDYKIININEDNKICNLILNFLGFNYFF